MEIHKTSYDLFNSNGTEPKTGLLLHRLAYRTGGSTSIVIYGKKFCEYRNQLITLAGYQSEKLNY
jgi:hypothetical protein